MMNFMVSMVIWTGIFYACRTRNWWLAGLTVVAGVAVSVLFDIHVVPLI